MSVFIDTGDSSSLFSLNVNDKKFLFLFCIVLNFIPQGCIKMFKSGSKDLYNGTKKMFQINSVLLNFLFIEESKINT